MNIWYARALACFAVAIWLKLDRAEPGFPQLLPQYLEYTAMFIGFAMLAIAEYEGV